MVELIAIKNQSTKAGQVENKNLQGTQQHQKIEEVVYCVKKELII